MLRREFKKLPKELHLFCPRQNDDDTDRYDDPDVDIVEGEERKFDVKKHDLIQEAQERRSVFFDCLQLFAFDGGDSYKQDMRERIDDALGKCDLCIRGYYLGKLDLRQKLRNDYDDPEVDAFFQVVDQQDIKRLCRGLTEAAEQLRQAPPEKRGITTLDREQLLAISEALVCEPFLEDEDLLKQYFDEPFKLIQTKRHLRSNTYTLASTRFLFDSHPVRSRWAILEWGKFEKPPTELEFEWTIKDCLSQQLHETQLQPTANNVQRLWRALQLMLNKFTKVTITHNLRALDVDVCRLALEHFSVDTPGLQYILQALQRILIVTPSDFWDAMASVRPSTVVEQICSSPQFEKLLNDQREGQALKTSGAASMLAWVLPFVDSIKPANLPVVARTITDQLLQRSKKETLVDTGRLCCFQTVMKVLEKSLMSFVENEDLRKSVARGVLTELIDIVTDSATTILEPLRYVVYPEALESARNAALNVVRLALSLDTLNLKSDFESLTSSKRLTHRGTSYSKQLWDEVISRLNEADVVVSTMALSGLYPLPGLEEIALKEGSEYNDWRTKFNGVLQKFTSIFATMLERLGEFRPEHLDELFKNQNTSMILISALSFADNSVYQAGSDLIKNVSGQFGRREAMAHLLQAFLATTLSSLSYTCRRLSSMRTFAGVPRMIKTGMDVLEILTDSQTGLLRTQKYDRQSRAAIQKYWQYQWQELRIVFKDTERWHSYIGDKDMMKDFCRDTMQYAEALFEQYTVFASAVEDVSTWEDVDKQLLQAPDCSPASAMEFMVKWLRLRDEYLVNTLVKVLTKLLHRLGGQDVKIDALAIKFVEDSATSDIVRTNLTQQQKAEIVRALEAYNKKPFLAPSIVGKKKQKTIEDWTSAASSGTSSPQVLDDYDDFDVPDDDLIEISKSLDTRPLQKQQLPKDPRKPQPQASKLTKPLARSSIAPTVDRSQFLAQRGKERAALKQRNAEAAARLRGNRGIGAETKGQGSGLQGIGVEDKDHSRGADSMMVSSDSDSDSEDEIDRELFGKLRPSKKLNTSIFPGIIKKPQPSGPIKKIKQLRSAKDMRARLQPDLSALHKTILSWEFFADGDLPPNANGEGYSIVSNSFRSALEYQKIFEPLLILEGWQSFRSAKEDGNFSAFQIKVGTRMNESGLYEVNTTMALAKAKELSLRESDVVLLSTAKQPWADPDQPHCLARVMRSSAKKGEREVVYRLVPGGPESLSQFLSPGKTIWGASVLSLTTLEREYGGLSALQYYDLCDEIIRAKPSPILDYTSATLKPLKDIYDVNDAQAKAIKSALDNDAFTLIQGPPGSGKTKTICALVGAVLSGSGSGPLQANGPFRPSAPNSGRSSPHVSTLPSSKKILVCAPSNAAVDELVMRLKTGVKTINGKQEKINVVRLGRSDAINVAVKDVTMDELVAAKLNVAVPRDPNYKDIGELMNQHKEASTKVIEIRDKLDQTRAKGRPVNPTDTQEFEGWKRKKANLGAQIDSMRDKNNSMQRDIDVSRRKIQQEIIDGAHVLCATLSGSGHDMFHHLNIEFDTVIIDEAAQSVELSALIPLKYGCSKCILVGDPRQLPPTVLSKAASKYAYEQSLFARMEKNHSKDVHLLDTQYRMHPEISAFPSREFYESRLKDGAGMAKIRARPWHNSSILGPYRFFDVQGMHQSAPKGHSLANIAEVQIAMQLYERLINDCRPYDFKRKIGIITPYKGQLRELRIRFSQRYGEEVLSEVEFNTTDAFQGRECEIIIFSCVRASTKSIGFLDDIRRMNVGLTRAMSSMWVLGNSQALMRGEYWQKLVADARSRNLYTDGDIPLLLSRPLLTPDMMKADVAMTDDHSDASSSSLEQRRRPALAIPQPKNTAVALRSPIELPSRRVSQLPSRPGSAQSRPATSSSSRPDTPKSDQSQRRGSSSSGPDTLKLRQPHRQGTYGPSGGGNGLNALSMCGLCGSFEHYTHNCDNYDAQVASKGACYRCQSPTHLSRDCRVARCLECGSFGHEANACTEKSLLSKKDKERIARQEESHKRQQAKAQERAKDRQLGEHGATVPIVRSTLPDALPSTRPSRPQAPTNAPRGPRVSSASRPLAVAPGAPVSLLSSTSPQDPNSAKRKRPQENEPPNFTSRPPKTSRPLSLYTPAPSSSSSGAAAITQPPHRPQSISETTSMSQPLPKGNKPPPPAPGSKGVLKRPKPKERDLFHIPKKR